MDFSKLKLGIYDLLGVILPGLIAICEGWIFLRGWNAFVTSLNRLSGTGFTVLLLVSFIAGNLVEELGDSLTVLLMGERYFKKYRDSFWASAEAEPVKRAINKEVGSEIKSVDTAFDYCLTKLKNQFEKRNVFVATADLSRSAAILAVLALAPLGRFAVKHAALTCDYVLWLLAALGVVALTVYLSWRRMLRFRELSETTVFRAYLAVASGKSPKS